MKKFFVSSLLLLVTPMFLFSAQDPCSEYRTAMVEARARATELENKINELVAEAEDVIFQLTKTQVLRIVLELTDKLRQLKREISRLKVQYDIYNEKAGWNQILLEACEARYHRCNGCGLLIEAEGITGHRSLLCPANHTYYECNASQVYDHTTTTSCPPTGAHQMLLCQTSGHDHLCSGCQNLYNPWDSLMQDVHRTRTCYYCNQTFRKCDSNLYCSESLTWTHSGY